GGGRVLVSAGSRAQVVGEDAVWAEKGVIVDGHAVVDRDAVLDGYLVPDRNAALDEDALTQITAAPDPRPSHDVREGPDARPGAYRVGLDDSQRVDSVRLIARHHTIALRRLSATRA